MRYAKETATILITLAVLLTSVSLLAQSEQGIENRVFGLGQPQSAQHLPPGQLRDRLESLPPQASAKALRWLQDFSFPESDLDTLKIDGEGNVLYHDTLLPDPEKVEQSDPANGPTLPSEIPQATLDDAFMLHSKPGSTNVVFIDFDGATITGTAWNGSNAQIDAVPYNIEGDASTFSTLERTRIVDIWHRVAEDLAPFDIDVTTQEPTTFNSTTGHILVTHTVDANGDLIYCSSCGGVAYVNVFGNSSYHTYYSPALVFFDKLGNGGETYVAEASSHEFGHNLGLSHDGHTDGTTYYGGQGSGLVSWAPIMGNSYNNNVTQFSKGEYNGANQGQDDLSIIDGKLGYRSDDHGDTIAAASTMSIDPNGTVISSNPELDPHNILTANKGVIGSSSDVDVFSIAAGDGALSLTVNPSWDAFYRSSSRRGSNLDIDAELQDNSGATVVIDDPTNDTTATVSATVTAGTYYLLVTGVGNSVTPYSDYDSLGQYFISGSVPPTDPDTTPPTPNPMTWASAPSADSHNAISMTATTATDDFGSVEYNFMCTIGGTGCTNSGWQSSSSHTATGLAASTQYTYKVVARDQSLNETNASAIASATTDAPPPPPADPTGLSANGISETEIDLAWSDNANNETGYRVERSPDGLNTFSTITTLGVNANSYSDTGLASDTTYDYRVAAYNDTGDSGYDTASGTTDAPPAWTNFNADSQTLVAGTVTGGLSNTYNDDTLMQSIRERESGGRKSNRHSYLEQRWNFNVSLGASVDVYLNAWSSGSGDGDSFDFEYSLDNGNSFLAMFNVSSTDSANLQSFTIPGAPSGSIIIRVIDTDRTSGNRELNTIFVNHLYIQVGNPSTDPPIGDPSGLSATASSSSQIDLSWIDGTDNESGFTVDRSTDELNWSQVADLPGGSTSHNDTGLTAETRYYYRVRAYNGNGFSAYTYADATTPVAPALTLSASGYKVKGKHHVALDWTGSSNVDVYRDGVLITTVSGNSHDDNIGTKGGATYTHQVCEAGTAVCSTTTTTDF